MTERSLPHSLEAERAILGAVLLQNDALATVADSLQPEDFYRDAHSRIYRRMLALSDLRQPIELITLAEALRRAGDLEEAGGPSYLSALIDGVPRGANIEAYAGIVREKHSLRTAIFTASKLSALAYAAEAPAQELAADAAERLQALSDGPDSGDLVTLAEILPSGLEALERATAAGTGTIAGLATGFTKLDDLMSGLQPSDLILIAARTSQGKTALALNIAYALAVPVLIFSLEMSKQQVLMRLLSSEARVDSHSLRTGHLGKHHWGRIGEAYGRLAERQLIIADRPGVGVREVRAQGRRAIAKYSIGAIVVDYIQLMKGRGKFDNRTQEIGTISRGLKEVARELNLPIVALSQLSRAVEAQPGRKAARRPQLSDLAESGSLENDADVVLLIYRPEPKGDDAADIAEIIVAKQRNGPCGTVNLRWNAAIVRFENLDL